MVPTPGHRFCLHGSAIQIDLHVPALEAEVSRVLYPRVGNRWPDGLLPINGAIRPFDYTDVARHVSRKARLVAGLDDLIELYREGETYWLVDERWGMSEINLLKNQWRSWVLPRPAVDTVRCVEAAVMWPIAQLLRRRGTELLPAISIERNGWGALIISPYGIQPELSRLLRAGYRIIGQRWTVIREAQRSLALLHVPGAVEQYLPPQIGSAKHGVKGWVDLLEDRPWSSANQAQCQAILMIEPGRRSITRGRELSESAAPAVLRHAWPIVRLPGHRRIASLPIQLARQCHCLQVQLSRCEDDFLQLVESLRHRPARMPITVPIDDEVEPSAPSRVEVLLRPRNASSAGQSASTIAS